MKRQGERRIVITGVGPVTPAGCGREEFWRNIRVGLSATRRIDELPTGFPVSTLRSQIAAWVIDPLSEVEDNVLRRDRRLWLGDLALRLAVDDSGLDDRDLSGAAVVVGNAVGAARDVEGTFCAMENGGVDPARVRPHDLLKQLSFHSFAHGIASRYRCRGPVLTISTGCTAGLDAVGTAYDLLRAGCSDVAITGSSEAPLAPVVFAAFDLIGALSRRNDDPERASRPFDRDRDGFVLAEGAAVLVLEERERALARGAHIYAELSGFASVSNRYHMTNLPSDGRLLGESIERALADAGAQAQDIDHVNAHGSSTPQNDLCETNAIKSALGRRSGEVSVNSLKSMIGHSLGASNAIEVAACALMLDRQHVFPTINLDHPDDGCDLDYVANHGRAARIRHLLKLSSGFSGIHSAMVMSAAEAL